MTIALDDTEPRISYAAPALGQTAFDVPFVFFDEDDLVVYVDDTLQVITTDYTVSQDEDGTGTLTFVDSQVSVTVTITREVPIERVTQFPESGPFSIPDLNTELNRIVAMLQQELSDQTRSIRQPTSDEDDLDELPVAASRASKYLFFDADGQPTVVVSVSSAVAASAFMETVLDDTTAAAARATLGVTDLTATQYLLNWMHYR